VKGEFEKLTAEKAKVTEEAFARCINELDALRQTVWNEALNGDRDAIGAVLAIIDRRTRLMGLRDVC
jgi:hypothetical protein